MADEVLTPQKLLDASADCETIEVVTNGDDQTDVTSRLGQTMPTIAKALRIILQMGIDYYPTQVVLLASTPIAGTKAGKALDTKKLFLWEGGAWVDTGLSELDQALNFVNSNHLFNPLRLTASDNLNSIKKSGVYIAQGFTPSLSNSYPAAKAGTLIAYEMYTGSTGTLIPQTYHTFDGEIFTRGTTTTNGVDYTVWDRVLTEKNAGSITAIHNVDLNTVVKNGRYIATADASLALSLNFPTIQKYIIDVTAKDDVVYQIAYLRNANEIYTRNFYGSAWGAWNKISHDSDLTAIRGDIAITNAEVLKVKDVLDYSYILQKDLMNPLKPTRIKLIGDSITWGMGGSAGSPTEPRNGTLADVRNTIDTSVSKTWANLLRTWIAKTYGNENITQDKAGSGYTINKLCTTWSDLYKLVKMTNKDGGVLADALKLSYVVYDTAMTTNGSSIRLVNNQAITTRPCQMEIPFFGDNITIDYLEHAVGDAGDIVEVYLDNVLHGTFNYYKSGAINYNAQYQVITTEAQHTVKLVNRATNINSYTNIYGFTVDKKIYIGNDGIIGSSTKSWLDRGLFEGSLNVNDDFVFLMLGTNDRATAGGLDSYKKRLRDCVAKIQSLSVGAKIILMSSTFAGDESEATYKFHMKQVADVNAVLSKEINARFVNHYKYCAQHLLDGETIWSDGLHLNDLGNKLYFQNILKTVFSV